MSRPATGAPRWAAKLGMWQAWVVVTPGAAPIPYPIPGIAKHDVVRARAAAKVIADRERSDPSARPAVGETVAAYSKRWLDYRDGKTADGKNNGKKVASNRDNESHIRNHILPCSATSS